MPPMKEAIEHIKKLRGTEKGIQPPTEEADAAAGSNEAASTAARGTIEEVMELAKETEHVEDVNKLTAYGEECFDELVTLDRGAGHRIATRQCHPRDGHRQEGSR